MAQSFISRLTDLPAYSSDVLQGGLRYRRHANGPKAVYIDIWWSLDLHILQDDLYYTPSAGKTLGRILHSSIIVSSLSIIKIRVSAS